MHQGNTKPSEFISDPFSLSRQNTDILINQLCIENLNRTSNQWKWCKDEQHAGLIVKCDSVGSTLFTPWTGVEALNESCSL